MSLLPSSLSGRPRPLLQGVRSDRPSSRHGRQDHHRVKIPRDVLVNARLHHQLGRRVVSFLLEDRHQGEPANLARLVHGQVLQDRVSQVSAPTGLAVRHLSLAMVNSREQQLESPAKPGPAVLPPAIRTAAQCRQTSPRRTSGARLSEPSSRPRPSSRPPQPMLRRLVVRHLPMHLIRLGPQEPREVPGHVRGQANATLLAKAFSRHRPRPPRQVVDQPVDQPREIEPGRREAWPELSRQHGNSLSERNIWKRSSIQMTIRTISTSTT